MPAAKRAAKPAKPKKLKINLTVQIDGERGMADFARMLAVLHDNGFQAQVHRLVQMLVAAADKQGAAVPPELREL